MHPTQSFFLPQPTMYVCNLLSRECYIVIVPRTRKKSTTVSKMNGQHIVPMLTDIILCVKRTCLWTKSSILCFIKHFEKSRSEVASTVEINRTLIPLTTMMSSIHSRLLTVHTSTINLDKCYFLPLIMDLVDHPLSNTRLHFAHFI